MILICLCAHAQEFIDVSFRGRVYFHDNSSNGFQEITIQNSNGKILGGTVSNADGFFNGNISISPDTKSPLYVQVIIPEYSSAYSNIDKHQLKKRIDLPIKDDLLFDFHLYNKYDYRFGCPDMKTNKVCNDSFCVVTRSDGLDNVLYILRQVNGKLHGMQETYYPSGKIRAKDWFEHGHRVKTKQWFENGDLELQSEFTILTDSDTNLKDQSKIEVSFYPILTDIPIPWKNEDSVSFADGLMTGNVKQFTEENGLEMEAVIYDQGKSYRDWKVYDHGRLFKEGYRDLRSGNCEIITYDLSASPVRKEVIIHTETRNKVSMRSLQWSNGKKEFLDAIRLPIQTRETYENLWVWSVARTTEYKREKNLSDWPSSSTEINNHITDSISGYLEKSIKNGIMNTRFSDGNLAQISAQLHSTDGSHFVGFRMIFNSSQELINLTFYQWETNGFGSAISIAERSDCRLTLGHVNQNISVEYKKDGKISREPFCLKQPCDSSEYAKWLKYLPEEYSMNEITLNCQPNEFGECRLKKDAINGTWQALDEKGVGLLEVSFEKNVLSGVIKGCYWNGNPMFEAKLLNELQLESVVIYDAEGNVISSKPKDD